jgi:hypothetical protein
MRKNTQIYVGILGSLGLFALYLTTLTLAESFSHALEQFASMWFWIILLVIGFGVQLGLYTFMRINIRRRKSGHTAKVATTGGISTGAMIACCAHHLVDVLPVLGFSAAALFLVKYQLPFIVLGIFANLVGIVIMLAVIQKLGLKPQKRFLKVLFTYKMQRIRTAAIILAAVVVGVSFLMSTVRASARDKVVPNSVPELAALINDENFITIEVEPFDFGFNKPLRFHIGMNTHRGDLDFDLTKISVLVDDRGNTFQPLEWQGSPAGGHHRTGVLIFQGLDAQTRWFKLIIRNVYDIPERIFQWEFS